MKVTIIPIVIGGSWFNHRRIIKETGGLGNNKTKGKHPNYYIIENGQNTEKSPGDFRIFAVTQHSSKKSIS